jgi:hypothetical protein
MMNKGRTWLFARRRSSAMIFSSWVKNLAVVGESGRTKLGSLLEFPKPEEINISHKMIGENATVTTPMKRKIIWKIQVGGGRKIDIQKELT